MGKIPYCGKEVRKPQDYSRWSPERLALARRLDASGYTNEQIAEVVGSSRGAVIQALARHRQSEGAGA